MKSQLTEQKITEKQLEKILSHLHIESIESLIILSLDAKGKVFYQTINNSSKVVDNIYKEINL